MLGDARAMKQLPKWAARREWNQPTRWMYAAGSKAGWGAVAKAF